MLFNSLTYIIFLLMAVTVYYLLPAKLRNAFLLAASMVFYMWSMPQYAVIVAFVTVFSFFAAKLIDKTEAEKKRSGYLAISIIVCLSFLLVFKYYNFFMDEITVLLSYAGVTISPIKLTWLQPLGISFYTFQVVGYLVDVRNKKVTSEENFTNYALFVTFFPQILAGPIGRASELLPQYKQTHSYEYSGVVEGLQRFLTGAFKKVVIADGIGIIVDGVYGNLSEYKGLTLLAAVILYVIQMYCDFSGYSDMAIGSARLLGFKLRENFKTPYLATNLGDFWSRWHMSLTSWFTDYIFTPLVWSRWANKLAFGKRWQDHKPHFAANLIIVFLISGLWHGAGMTYVVWGLIHGVVRVLEELIAKLKPKKKKKAKSKAEVLFGRVKVLVIWAVSLVFFRAASLSDAGYVLSNMFKSISVSQTIGEILHLTENDMASSGAFFLFFWGTIFLSYLLVALFDRRLYRAPKGADISNNALSLYSTKLRWLFYWFMSAAVLMFYFISLTGNNKASFIYLGF